MRSVPNYEVIFQFLQGGDADDEPAGGVGWNDEDKPCCRRSRDPVTPAVGWQQSLRPAGVNVGFSSTQSFQERPGHYAGGLRRVGQASNRSRIAAKESSSRIGALLASEFLEQRELQSGWSGQPRVQRIPWRGGRRRDRHCPARDECLGHTLGVGNFEGKPNVRRNRLADLDGVNQRDLFGIREFKGCSSGVEDDHSCISGALKCRELREAEGVAVELNGLVKVVDAHNYSQLMNARC